MEGYRNTKEFLAGRDEALLSGDPEQVRRHLMRAGTPGAADESAAVMEIALHKGRIHWRDCPPEKLYESVWWLHDHNYKLDY